MNESDKFSVALVGAGNMGGAMLAGWLDSALDGDDVTVIDPAPNERMLDLIRRHGVVQSSTAESVKPPDVLVLAVKPQIIDDVMAQLTGIVAADTVVVSVAAGISLAQLQAGLGGHDRVVRAMPNTPSLVGRGMTVGCAAKAVSTEQRRRVEKLLGAVGSFEWVEDESLMDAVTAVSGSGPAYVFLLAECMAKAGEAAGLPAELALKLACETVSGAGELMRQSEDGPATLRQNVTSPNGTTAAALAVLMEDDSLADLMAEAIEAGRRRSRELSGDQK